MKYTCNPFESFPGLKTASLLILRMALTINEERFEKVLQENLNVSVIETWVMLAAAEREVNQSTLGGCLGVGKNQMVRLIDSMEKRKLVQRERDPKNRRAMLIQLTPQGEKTVKAIYKNLAKLRTIAYHPMPPEILENQVLPLALKQIEEYFKEKDC